MACRSIFSTRTACISKGATRGDGTRGEDVSANIATIAAIPPRIDDAAVPVSDGDSRRGLYEL